MPAKKEQKKRNPNQQQTRGWTKECEWEIAVEKYNDRERKKRNLQQSDKRLLSISYWNCVYLRNANMKYVKSHTIYECEHLYEH